jgi:NADH-quinone oxidoreductase subunit N
MTEIAILKGTQSLYFSFLPEIFMTTCILGSLIYNTNLRNSANLNYPLFGYEIANQTFLILFFTFLLVSANGSFEFASTLFVNNSGVSTIKQVVLLFAMFILPAISRAFKIENLNFFEYYILFMFSVLSLLFLTSCNDFLSAYLVLELQGLSFYVLAGFRRRSAYSTDAGIKYFLLGSFFSCVFLLGCSLLYACVGTLNFTNLRLVLAFTLITYSPNVGVYLFISISLILVSLLFKLAIAPFHFWAPDVYEGSPLASAIIYAVLPKISLLYFLSTFLILIGEQFFRFDTLLTMLGMYSMFFGLELALRQTRLKRLVIYSSVSQSGFFILALSLGEEGSGVAMFTFLFAYLLSTVLIWNLLIEFHASQQSTYDFCDKSVIAPLHISDLSNFFQHNKVLAILLFALIFSIGGMPPSSGFLAKAMIIQELLMAGKLKASVFAIVIGAYTSFYYIRLIKVLFFENESKNRAHQFIHSIFPDLLMDAHYFVTVLGVFGLYFFFFCPEFPLLIAKIVVVGSHF